MPLHIHSRFSLSEIQQVFQQQFPALKIEYSFKGNESFQTRLPQGKPFPRMRINELMPQKSDADLFIDETMTVEEVEYLFWKKFELPVQVYTRKGGYWLKTALSNSLQLKSLF